MVGLHRLVIAESLRFPELAQKLYDNGDMWHIARLADHVRSECGQEAVIRAEPLYVLLWAKTIGGGCLVCLHLPAGLRQSITHVSL